MNQGENKTPAGTYSQLMEVVEEKKRKTESPIVRTIGKKSRKSRAVVRKDKQGIAYGRTGGSGVRTDALLQLVPPSPDKRRPERYAFQFWADQITRLKKVKQIMNITKDPEDREEVSLSDMVREAIDDYINKQIKHLGQSVRSGE